MTRALSYPDYPPFLAELKQHVVQACTSAAQAVNRDLILLYCDIGRGIVEKQQTANRGDAVVDRLSSDLRDEFPDMRGFSARNIWDMKRLYLARSEPAFLQHSGVELRRKSARQEFLPLEHFK